MGIISETRFIERLQFFNGERLFASDLQGLEAFNREMRWLHNQSLHQPGIGKGFAVCGKKGDREVKIKPGYAIDSFGREIVLSESWVEAVPPVAGEEDGTSVFYDLTVSYPADSDLEEAETREGICLPRGVVRLREKPVFCWVRLQRDDKGGLNPKNPKLQSDIRDGLKIVLTRAEVLNCMLNKDISIAQRRRARLTRQPYIECGKTSADATGWQLWTEPNQDNPLGLKLRVDTSSARFSTVPCYSAHIVGDRLFVIENDGKLSQFLIDGFVSITDAGVAGFTLKVFMPKLNGMINPLAFFHENFFEQNGLKLLKMNGWHVVWMGIEE